MTEQAPSPAKRNSFFHIAATISLLALPLAVVLGVASNLILPLLPKSVSMLLAMLLGSLSILIILLGVGIGIVSLFGIPRYGRQGILFKALAGIILPLLLAGVAIPAVTKALAEEKSRGESPVEAQLDAVTAQINRQTPIRVDDDTRLDKAEVLPGPTMAYTYTVTTMQRKDFPDDAVEATIRPALVEAYRNHDDLKFLRENAVAVTYRYYDRDGEFIGETTITPEVLK